VRAGDAEAAAEVVRRYEKEIRRVIRTYLNDPRLRRTFDSMDICQSVLANFFVRAAAGQFDLDDPGQLIRLLLKMARNKLNDKVREQQAERRDQRRVEGSPAALEGVAAATETPSAIVEARDLMERARSLLSENERQIADLRSQGFNWDEVAERMGSSADGVRKQHARAIKRIAEKLGLGPDLE
jgi:RNA polymerase sigma-70 factor (ECF subfamily)